MSHPAAVTDAGDLATPGLRRDLVFHPDGGRRGGVVVEDPIGGRFTRWSRRAAAALRSIAPEHRSVLAIAADRGMCRTRRRSAPRGDVRRWLAIRIPILVGDRPARFLAPRMDALLSVTAIWFWGIAGIAVAMALVPRVNEMIAAISGAFARAPAAAGASVAATMAVTKAIHELGHATVCRRMGASVGSIGVMLFCGMPAPYCDVTDAWRLPQRHRRAGVMAAGIYAEWIVATVAGAVFLLTGASTAPTGRIGLHAVAAMVVGICFVGSVVFNANPLMRYDGYYVLADAVGSPSLAADAAAALRRVIARIMGDRRGRIDSRAGWLAGYQVARAVYRVGVTVSIATLILHFADAVGLRLAATALIVGAMVTALFRGGRRLFSFGLGRGRWSGGGTHPLRRWGALLGIVGLVAVVAGIPVPNWTDATGRLAAEFESVLVTPRSGRLSAVSRTWGDGVRDGETLATIDDEVPRDRRIEVDGKLHEAEVTLASLGRRIAQPRNGQTSARTESGRQHSGRQHFGGQHLGSQHPGDRNGELIDQWQVWNRQSNSLRRRRDEIDDQIRSSIIRAPATGWILSPPAQDDDEFGGQPVPSSRWVGRQVSAGETYARVVAGELTVAVTWPTAMQTPVGVGHRVWVRLPPPRRWTPATVRSVSPVQRSDFGPTVTLVGHFEDPVGRLPDQLGWVDSPVQVRVPHPRQPMIHLIAGWLRREVLAEFWP